MRLRALEPEDLPLLYTIENDRSLWWLSSQTAPLSLYHLRDYIAGNEADIYKDEQVRYAVEDDSGRAVGLVDVFNFSARDSRAELGIAILEAARCHGLAHAAIEEITLTARNLLRLHQLYALVPADNAASLSLFRSLGFAEGASLKDWLFHDGAYHDAIVMQQFL